MDDAPKPLPRTKIREQSVLVLNKDNEISKPREVLVHNSPTTLGEIDKQETSFTHLNRDLSVDEQSSHKDTVIEIEPEPLSNNHLLENDSNPEEIPAQISSEEQQNVAEDNQSDIYDKDGEDDDEVVNEILRYKKGNLERKLQIELNPSTSESSRQSSSRSNSSRTEISKINANTTTVTEIVEEDLLGIHIHRTDCLKMDRIIRHPSVIVHIVDADNKGLYLSKSKPNKNVTYNQEKSSFILPIMTRPFNFKEHKCIMPEWEETLTFNENTDYIIKPSVIFFFEIVDFIDSSNSDSDYASIGWHRIAWAFLKPVGTNNVRNVGNKLRLQLYQSDPKNTSINKSVLNIPHVYEWYRKRPWKPYPSTLFVTVTNISSNKVDSKPQQRSCTPLQPEIGSDSSVKSLALFSNEDESADTKSSENISAIYRLNNIDWSRLPGQSCRIPNVKVSTLHSDPRGSLAVKFSNSGIFLACGTSSEVFIYAIDGVLEKRLINHQGLIYTLCWFTDDSLLLSASADCTACIWDMKSSTESPLQILPHPSFVYCSTFIYPEQTIVTGCYDGIVRVWWHTHACSRYWQLHQELTGHEEYVSALCSFKNKEFFSGDSCGLIIHWTVDDCARWSKLHVIKLMEIQNTIINKLIVFPGQKRLLIHTRDSLLRTMDIKNSAVIQWYQGGLNDTSQCNSTITPCGSLVFASSEDGTINVWESNTAKHLAFYSTGNTGSGCGGTVDYHPLDHICAFSSYSTGCNTSSVHLLKYSINNISSMDVMLYPLNGSASPLRDPTKNKKIFDDESYSKFTLKKGKSKNTDTIKSKIKK